MHSLSRSDFLRTGRLHVFLKGFLQVMLSQSDGQTVPQFRCVQYRKMLRLQCVLRCFSGRHWRCKDETGWRTADDTLEGSKVLVAEGTGGGWGMTGREWGLCHWRTCSQKKGFCSQYAFEKVQASLAHGEWQWCDLYALHFAVQVGMWVGQRARACCMINETDHDDTLCLFIYRYHSLFTAFLNVTDVSVFDEKLLIWKYSSSNL